MFRPCIDLHEGRVKQIVGGSLGSNRSELKTNFVSDKPSSWYAKLYQKDGLRGGHVIMLGPGNENAAGEALRTYPGGLQVGGGINSQNAKEYLDAGASQVIVTSWVFREGRLDERRLRELSDLVGRERLVLDLSCRKRDGKYFVVTDRWRTFTEMVVCREVLEELAHFCVEFLVHAVDVEGLSQGIDGALVRLLGSETPIPATYAGGARSLADLEEVSSLGKGQVDLTIGSALDIFGGSGIRYEDAVAYNRKQARGLDQRDLCNGKS